MKFILVGPLFRSGLPPGGTERAFTLLVEHLRLSGQTNFAVVNTSRLASPTNSLVIIAAKVLREVLIISSFLRVSLVCPRAVVICFHSSLGSSFRLFLLALLSKFLFHRFSLFPRSGKDILLYSDESIYNRFFFKISLGLTSTIFHQTEVYSSKFSDFFALPAHIKSVVVPNWVPMPNSRHISKIPPAASLRVVMATSFEPHKCVLSSLLILRSLSQSLGVPLEVLIYGSGSQYSCAIEQFSSEVASGCFKFFGSVSRSEVLSSMAISHFFISMSSVEGLSNSLIEAMSFGLLPILSPSLILPDFLRSSPSVIVSSDPVFICDRVEEIVLEDSFVTLSMTVSRLAREHFSYPGNCQLMIDTACY